MARRIEAGDVSLDQLRAFVAVVDHGSFSSAGRALGRVQSAMSHSVASLEESLGLRLLDRSGYRPVLTSAGVAVLARARQVLLEVHSLAATAGALGGTVEPELALVVDAIFPHGHLVAFAQRFQAAWPSVRLRLQTEALSAVLDQVEDGACDLGVANADLPMAGLEQRPLGRVELVPVAAAQHPLALLTHPAGRADLDVFRQIVLSGRGREATEPDRGVLSSQTWRVLDLDAKQAFILAGLGWGSLPAHRAAADLAQGRLVRLVLAEGLVQAGTVALVGVWRKGARLGPAARWALDELVAMGAAP